MTILVQIVYYNIQRFGGLSKRKKFQNVNLKIKNIGVAARQLKIIRPQADTIILHFDI